MTDCRCPTSCQLVGGPSLSTWLAACRILVASSSASSSALIDKANLVGVKHVGLGSDFDGAIAAPFDTTGLVEITDSLIAEGFTETEIEMIMGGNVVRVLKQLLP